MERSNGYKTKQKEIVLAYLQKRKGNHVSVQEIVEDCHRQQMDIGTTTVYRQLDKLVQEGKTRKYLLEGLPGAVYEYVASPEKCSQHLHLKCEKCGTVDHLECDFMSRFDVHILEKHGFLLDKKNSLLLGTCRKCQEKEKQQNTDKKEQ